MRKAVECWKAAQYWQDRAKGAIRLAKYKERPDVRARRIKGLEADKRKQEHSQADAQKFSRHTKTHRPAPRSYATGATCSGSAPDVGRWALLREPDALEK